MQRAPRAIIESSKNIRYMVKSLFEQRDHNCTTKPKFPHFPPIRRFSGAAQPEPLPRPCQAKADATVGESIRALKEIGSAMRARRHRHYLSIFGKFSLFHHGTIV